MHSYFKAFSYFLIIFYCYFGWQEVKKKEETVKQNNMDLNEFPPKYDYDFLDGTDEAHLKQILFFTQPAPPPPSRLMVPFLKSGFPLNILDQNTMSKFLSHQNQDNIAS